MSGSGRRGGVGPVVAQECPQHVDAAAGQGQDGLGVFFPFGAFAVVEGAGVGRAADADQRGGVEDAVEHAVVAARPVQVAGAAAGVAGGGGQAGVAGEVVGGGEGVHVAAGGDEELGAEQGGDAGQAGDQG